MAELFLAERPDGRGGVERLVQKRLLPGLDESHQRLFAREGHVLGRVDSPHVVRLVAAASDHLLLEFVDGPNLAALLDHLRRRGRRLSLGGALAVIEGLARGLAALHDAVGEDGRPLEAVHRDVNPSNVLVSSDGAVKLADLGVVRVAASDQPTVAGFKGTLAYMAPEQLLGRPVDRRTDLYAAGLVAYEVLTGTPARPAGMIGLAELLDARTRLPAPPSTLRRDVPASADAAILAALSPDPAARPSDAGAWLEAVRAAFAVAPDPGALGEVARAVDRPITASFRTLGGEPGAPAGLPRPGRRRRTWTVAGAVAAIVAAAAATAIGWPGDETPADPADPAAAAIPAPPASPSPVVPAVPASATPVPPPAAGPAPVAAVPPPAAPAAGLPSASPPPRRDVPIRVLVRPDGGPIHVQGAGAQGLAPRTTEPLAQGASVLTLHGGPEGFPPVLLRVVRTGDRLAATIGTFPDRHFNRIRCGGRDVGETLAAGLPLRDELRCTIAADEGTLGFVVGVAR